jgi:magnesium chelatase subunit D
MAYPFAAVLGNANAKRALLLLAIDRDLRGVLISSSSGSGKSLLARSAQSLFQATALCHIPDPPFVELPIGVSEGRLLGGLDIERSLISGRRHYDKGLIQQADGGVLYVDDINLLEADIAQRLACALDAKSLPMQGDGLNPATGADFVFIGSYNIEEGEVPSLLRAKVGMIIESEYPTSLHERAEVINRASEYQTQPADFIKRFGKEAQALGDELREARQRLPGVEITKEVLRQISSASLALGIEGHQADIFAARVAKANAALCRRQRVEEEDLITAMQLVLLPRALRMPTGFVGHENSNPQQHPTDSKEDEQLAESKSQRHQDAERLAPTDQGDEKSDLKPDQSVETLIDAEPLADDKPESLQAKPYSSSAIEDLLVKALEARLPQDALKSPIANRQPNGRSAKGKPTHTTKRKRAQSSSRNRGRATGHSLDANGVKKIAIAATLRAAAPFQQARRRTQDSSAKALQITRKDLRYRRFKQKNGLLFIFAVDASGSMALHRLAQAKGAMTRLLQEAYLHRDKVALISFRQQTAEVLLQPTRSVELAKRLVDALPAGGATPLAAALAKAKKVSELAHSQTISQSLLLLFTDGRANVAFHQQEPAKSLASREIIQDELRQIGRLLQRSKINVVIIDSKPKFLPGGEAKELAEILNAEYIYLPRADDKTIYQSVSKIAKQVRIEEGSDTV